MNHLLQRSEVSTRNRLKSSEKPEKCYEYCRMNPYNLRILF